MATHAIASIVEGSRIRDTGKSDYSTEAQVGSEEKDVSDALEISEMYPNNAPSGHDKITLDKAAPNTSVQEIAMDQQTIAEVEAVASETPMKQEKVVPKQAILHPEVSALSDSVGSQLHVLANLPSLQEPECSKQSEIQSTSRAAYQTAKYELSEETSYYDGDEEEMDSIELQLWIAVDYPADKRYLTDSAAAEDSKSPLKKGKKSGAPKQRKPSRATIMDLKTPQTPIKSVKMSHEAMPTSASTPDLNIDKNAQSTKTTPESSQKKCNSNPPTSPMELTTGHMETAGSATKKRVQQSRGSTGNHKKRSK